MTVDYCNIDDIFYLAYGVLLQGLIPIQMNHVCIIGNGIAGVTAARHIRKLRSARDCEITIISTETDHFFSRTALMYIYMGHMTYEHTKPYEDGFWPKNDINLLRDYVTRVDTEQQKLHLQAGGDLSYDVLLLATGSSGNRAGWPGENLKGSAGDDHLPGH